MSITDVLPEAPESYEWRTSLVVNEDTTLIYLRLETSSDEGAPPKVPESYQDIYEFCPPEEDFVISAAGRILKRFEDGVRKTDQLKDLKATETERYSHLLTDLGVTDG